MSYFSTRRDVLKTIFIGSGVQWIQACGGSEITDSIPQSPSKDNSDPSNLFYDVLVYGGTPSGLMAAAAAANAGSRVILVEPSMHIGGMQISGISKTDYRGYSYRFMNPLTRDFYISLAAAKGMNFFDAIKDHWNFTGSEYMSIIRNTILRYKFSVITGARIMRDGGINKKGARVVDALFENSTGQPINRISALQFIDASYTADMATVAGISFTSGRESTSKYNETLAGVRNTRRIEIDPYITIGNPNSGLLPGITNKPAPAIGSADDSLQWSCHRLILTKLKSHQIKFKIADKYDPNRYLILRRWMQTGKVNNLNQVFTRYPINSDLGLGMVEAWNNNFITLNMLGGQNSYPSADYNKRFQLDIELENYTLGLFYWLTNDDSVPNSIKNELSQWGLLSTEIYNSNSLPPFVYRREGRRMVNSKYTITEHDVLGKTRTFNGIAYGYYNIDIHDCASWFDGERLVIDGLISASPKNIYPIDRNCTLPMRSEAENMQISVCISASHVAWGSVRIEPTLQSIGEACGLIASISASSGESIHDIDVQKIRKTLDFQEPTQDYLMLCVEGDPNFSLGTTTIYQKFGFIEVTGSWDFEKAPIGWFHAARGNYHDRGTGKGEKSIRFYPKFEKAGIYRIRAWMPSKDSEDMPDSDVVSVIIFADELLHEIKIYPKTNDIVGSIIGEWKFGLKNLNFIEINNSSAGGRGSRLRISAISWELIDPNIESTPKYQLTSPKHQ